MIFCFIEDIEYILENSSKKRRVYLFSATMPQRIKDLSKKYMKKQEIIEVKKKKEDTSLIEQSFYKSKQVDKFDALTKLIDTEDFFYGIVFCRTKADVDNVTQSLKSSGHRVDCIHGDIAQNKREKILDKFKNQKLSILVATDVAARGVHVNNLSHVINYNLPDDVETYTHRIGRTGRAGNKGKAISLVTVGEMRRISLIEKTLHVKIESKKLPSDKEVSKKNNEKFVLEVDKVIENADLTKYLNVADELLEKNDALRVVSALLHKINGSTSSSVGDNNKKTSKKTRVFIAKGRFDKMDKKGLIHFIQRETRIKLGDVDDVKVCDKFSFLTLESNEAERVVAKFEQISGKRKSLAEFASN